MQSTLVPRRVLHQAGFRITPGRVRLLNVLAGETRPLTVRQIQEKLGKTGLNEVTLYRALEALAATNIVRRVDLRHGQAYRYELADQHHHHIVCTDCGIIEDFSDSRLEKAMVEAAQKSRSFKKINNHAMELFGLCTDCS